MLKRAFDVVASAAGVLVLAPVFAVLAVLIRRDSEGPVFFKQRRVGLRGEPFFIVKFRTMRAAVTGANPELTVKDDTRVTKIGAMLRHYKLDELPQLLNVLRGEMSLVGPRPEVPRYVDAWDDETKATVLSVRPGMTDLASIQFRNESALLEASADPEHKYLTEIVPAKNALTMEYVKHRSFWLDLKILGRTFLAILR